MMYAIHCKPVTRTKPEPCRCSGYPFPHRPASGKCHDDGSGCFCGDCGKPTDPIKADFGYGPLEAWGHRFTHRDERIVSKCCEAELYSDASLTELYQDYL